MRISQIMTTNLHTIDGTTTLAEAQAIFARAKYHHLPVMKQEALVGIISDRDIYRLSSPFRGTEHEDQRDEDWQYTQVSSFMTKNVVTVTEESLIDVASILLLEHCISCLPVLSTDEKLVGIVTWKDLLQYYTYINQASELKLTSPPTL